MEKKERKRIVLSSNTAFSLYNFRLHLMRALKEKGYEVMAISPEDGKYSELLRKEFSFFAIKNLDRKGTNPIKDLKLFFEYFLLFKKLKPDLVINFTIKPNIYGSISAMARLPRGCPTLLLHGGLCSPAIILQRRRSEGFARSHGYGKAYNNHLCTRLQEYMR